MNILNNIFDSIGKVFVMVEGSSGSFLDLSISGVVDLPDHYYEPELIEFESDSTNAPLISLGNHSTADLSTSGSEHSELDEELAIQKAKRPNVYSGTDEINFPAAGNSLGKHSSLFGFSDSIDEFADDWACHSAKRAKGADIPAPDHVKITDHCIEALCKEVVTSNFHLSKMDIKDIAGIVADHVYGRNDRQILKARKRQARKSYQKIKSTYIEAFEASLAGEHLLDMLQGSDRLKQILALPVRKSAKLLGELALGSSPLSKRARARCARRNMKSIAKLIS